MSKLLQSPDQVPRVIAPTTTRKLAQRMLSASSEIARAMPHGFYAPVALDVLLRLHVAEDDAHYLAISDLDVPGATSSRVVERWVIALHAEGLLDRKGDLLALTQKGYDLVVHTITAIYDAQRALDDAAEDDGT